MVSVKGTKQALALAVIVLIAASIALKLYSGIGLQSAVLDTILSSLEVSYYGVSIASAGKAAVLVSKMLDTLIPPIFAFLLASIFLEAISSISIRESLARSKISRMRGHVIITPSNLLSKKLAECLAESGTDAVVIAKSKAELDDLYDDGITGIVGDTASAESMLAAGLPNAFCVVASSYDDMKNALVALTAKARAPKIKVVSVVNRSENADKMASIGVEGTITPELTAGTDIAKKIIRHVYSSGWTKQQ
jgi:voltage-gated potassium channel